MGYPEMMRDVMEQIRREETRRRRKDLENMTIIDHLTGLYNQGYFHLRLDEEMIRSKLYGNNLSLILLAIGCSLQEHPGIEIPVDHKIMKAMSEIISDCLEDCIGLAFSCDKGKFAIILPEVNKHEAASTVYNIQKMIRKETFQNINLYAGVVQYKDQEDIDELIKSADDALYNNIKTIVQGKTV